MIAQGLGRVALAERLSIPQLEEALENRSIPAYIGVPLLEEKVQMRERMQMAQSGMSPPPQMTIEDEILQRANRVEPQGIDSLPVDMPEFAGGGIVAFDDGGEVSRFQNQGAVLPMQARLRLRELMNLEERVAFDRTGTIPERLRENIPSVMPEEPQKDLRAPVEMRGGRPVPIGPGGEELGIEPPMPEAPQTGTAQPQMGNLLGRTEQLYKGLYGDEKPQAPDTKENYLNKAQEFFTMAGVDLNLASKQAQEIANQKAELEGDRREAKKHAVIAAGLAILGGDPANSVAENIGKGLGSGFDKYTTAINNIQKTEREMDALERSLAVAQNQSRMGLATMASGEYQAAQKRYDDLNKEMRSGKADLLKAVMSDDRTSKLLAAQGDKATDFTRKWNIYSEREKAAGRTPTPEGFSKAFGVDRETITDKEATRMAAEQFKAIALDPSNPEDAKKFRELVEFYKRSGAPVQAQMSEQDRQALAWANANPNDRRSKLIKEHLGSI